MRKYSSTSFTGGNEVDVYRRFETKYWCVGKTRSKSTATLYNVGLFEHVSCRTNLFEISATAAMFFMYRSFILAECEHQVTM